MERLSYQKLADDTVRERLQQLPGWKFEEGKLVKTFAFDDYAHGVLFTVAAAHQAEAMNHHPDLTLLYGKVGVGTSTHDAGGITSYDFELARRIEALTH